MSNVLLPLSGSGDVTASVATEDIGGAHYQLLKVMDGTPGSTSPIIGASTTPGSTDMGLVVRNIASTAFNQAVVGAVGLTSGSSAVELTSAGSTRLVGRVTVDSAVTVSGSVGLTSGSSEVALTSVGSTRLVGQVTVANPTTDVTVTGAVGITSGSSEVTLTSIGSTRLVGQMTVANPTTGVTVDGTVGLTSSTGQKGSFALASGTTGIMGAMYVSSGTQTIGTVQLSSAGTTGSIGSVALLAGSTATMIGSITVGTAGSTANTIGSAALLAGSSANTIGAVAQAPGSTSVAPWYVISTAATGGPGSSAVDANLTSLGSTKVVGTVNVSSGVILGAGSTGNVIGSVIMGTAGSTANTVGSVALLAGTTGTMVGAIALSSAGYNAVTQGAGSSANTAWTIDSVPFSSGGCSRTSISTTVDIQIVAANANRKALIIANRSTAQTVGCGFSTAAVTTGLANVDFFIGPSSFVSFGIQGGFPLYQGPLRGINLTSTTVAGSVGVVQFTT